MSRRLALAALLLATVPAAAADLPAAGSGDDAGAYGEDFEAWRRRGRVAEYDPCLAEWRRLNPPGAPIRATNSLCDPSYVGSGYGLARPSYYGTLPRLGHNAFGWTGPEGP